MKDAALDPALGQAIIQRISRIPIFQTLKMEVTHMAPGEFAVHIPRDLSYDGIIASLHGGILATLADSVAAYAILTLTGPDAAMATTDFSIRFLAPCLTGVTARAEVIKLGRSLAPSDVRLFDDNGKLVAVAQVSYMLLGETAGSASK